MRFEFDPYKAIANLKKHGIALADAEALFEDPLAVHRQDPDSESEERFVAIGRGSAGELLVAVYALRDSAIRLISVRRATRREAKSYEG